MIKGNWKEILTEEIQEDASSTTSQQGQAITYIALFFEIIGIIVVALSAIYLRFFPVETNSFKPSAWIQNCSDHTYNKQKGSQEYIWVFYTASLIIPIALITIGELENCSFPKNQRSKQLTGMERVIEGIPKFGRLIGLFVLGIFLTSLFIDYTKLLVSRPRPYFLSAYPEVCLALENIFSSDTFAIQSFPSHVAAIVAYCCLFSTCYCYIKRLYGRTPSLLIIATQCFMFLTVTACIDRYNNNFSHVEDIVIGLVVGIFFALYISYHICLVSRKTTAPLPVVPKWPLPRVSLPPVNQESNLRRQVSTNTIQSDNAWRKTVY